MSTHRLLRIFGLGLLFAALYHLGACATTVQCPCEQPCTPYPDVNGGAQPDFCMDLVAKDVRVCSWAIEHYGELHYAKLGCNGEWVEVVDP